ncbi:MAG: BglG family transcription antiterminator, partial [Lachnospiraceae bacterium]|nr:BglG family transcription antiterminator [Lachnospiraceae bacterium]
RLGVSKRTIQRESEYIEDAIRMYGLSLKNRKGAGIYLYGSEEGMAQLLRDLAEANVVGSDDKEERRRKILFALLKDRTPKKLFYFSNMLGVSEVTAANDMEMLRPWLSRYDLKLIKKPGYGVTIDGAEEDFRAAMRRFIADYGAARLFTENESDAVSDAVMDSIHKKSIYSLLKQDTVDRVRRVLKEMQEPALSMLADNAYMGLIIHIAIAVERIKNGGILESDQDLFLKNAEMCEETALAERILMSIEREFDLTMPQTEISYLMLHLRASKTAYTGNRSSQRGEQFYQESEELMELIDQMIDLYNPKLAYEMKSDEDFLEGLLMHLRPVVVRLKNHLDIYNPILADIQAEYSDVFFRCRQAAAVLERAMNTAISDEEIGFLAMHFGAVEEKIRKAQQIRRKVYIGVVCASGFGLARLMVARIRDHITSNIELHAYGREELTPFVISRNDFFVSSFDLTEAGVDYVLVKPLITQKDVTRIQAKVNEYAQMRRSSQDEDFARQLDAANFASREIKGLIDRYRHYQVSDNIRFSELLRYFAMMATTNLRDAGMVIEAIREREKMNSQVFPEFGICLLHCRTEGIREPLFLSCTPKKGNGFEDPYFRGVWAAVLLLMPVDEHQKENQDMLGFISAGFVRDEAFLKAFETGQEEKIREVLVKTMKQYFNELLEKL